MGLLDYKPPAKQPQKVTFNGVIKPNRQGAMMAKVALTRIRRQAIISGLLDTCPTPEELSFQLGKLHRERGSTEENPYINLKSNRPWGLTTLKKDMDEIIQATVDRIKDGSQYSREAQLAKLDRQLKRVRDSDMKDSEKRLREESILKEQNRVLRLHFREEGISKEQVKATWQKLVDNFKKLMPENTEAQRFLMIALQAAVEGKNVMAVLREHEIEKQQVGGFLQPGN